MLERHHVVHLKFPCDRLRDAAEEELWLPAVSNSKNRYEPLPLIPDLAVEANAFRSSGEETAIFALSPAQKCVRYHWENPREEEKHGLYGLVEVMRISKALRGSTTLRMLTYKSRAGVERMRIERNTITVRASKELQSDWTDYDFDFRDLQHCISSLTFGLQSDDQWLGYIIDLVHRRTDRAFLHVRHMLDSQDIPEPEAAWKAPRTPNYESALAANTAMTAPTLQSMVMEERTCIIRMEDCIEAPKQTSVALHCSAKHVFHLTCLGEWCKTQGPDRSNCPSCRRPIFTNRFTLASLKFGVKEDNVFEPDPRYSSWESFERSCADLDVALVEDDSALVTCSEEFTSDILQHIKFSFHQTGSSPGQLRLSRPQITATSPSTKSAKRQSDRPREILMAPPCPPRPFMAL